jgi:hypothetical protein
MHVPENFAFTLKPNTYQNAVLSLILSGQLTEWQFCNLKEMFVLAFTKAWHGAQHGWRVLAPEAITDRACCRLCSQSYSLR